MKNKNNPFKIVKRKSREIVSKLNKKIHSSEYPLIDSIEKYYYKTIKDSTVENIQLPSLIGFRISGNFNIIYPPIKIYRIPDVTIFYESNILLVSEGVYWDKRSSKLFSKDLSGERNVLDYNDNSIRLVIYDIPSLIKGKTLSLLAQFAKIWSHFVMQELPKVCALIDEAKPGERFNVLIEEESDKNILEIMKILSEKYECINLVFAKSNASYIIEELVYISPMVQYTNHFMYMIPEDCVFPKFTLDLLKKYVANQLVGENIHKKTTVEKIYLPRRDTYRTLTNWQEVEEFFVKQGFEIVEPHKMSMSEKANLFYNAKWVVGPYSSAMFNAFLCSSKTKMIVLSNLQRTMDSAIDSLASIGNCHTYWIVGDDRGSGPHASFYIQLSKIRDDFRCINEQ